MRHRPRPARSALKKAGKKMALFLPEDVVRAIKAQAAAAGQPTSVYVWERLVLAEKLERQKEKSA